MALRHAEPLGVLVHERGEGVLGARDALGERDRRVVAALHDHALYQDLDRHARVEVEVGARTFRAPGALADRQLGVELDLAVLQRLEHDVCRHQLGDARGLDRVARTVAGERLPALLVDEHPGLEFGERLGLFDEDRVAHLGCVVLVMSVVVLRLTHGLLHDRVRETAFHLHDDRLVLLVADNDALQNALRHLDPL